MCVMTIHSSHNKTWNPTIVHTKPNTSNLEIDLINSEVLIPTDQQTYSRLTTKNTWTCLSHSVLCVFFPYQVEFQQRGADHVHSLLWLDIVKMLQLSMMLGAIIVCITLSQCGYYSDYISLGQNYLTAWHQQVYLALGPVQCPVLRIHPVNRTS